MAVIGKGIEADVDAVIKFQITRARLALDKLDAMRLDAQELEDAGPTTGLWRKQQQTRARKLLKQQRPELENLIVDLDGVVQTSKGDEVIAGSGEGIDIRLAGKRIVTPECVGQVNRFFDAGGAA